MRISDWSSDVCSSDLDGIGAVQIDEALQVFRQLGAGLRLADHELVIGKLGVAQVQAARQAEPEGLLVAHHAGHAEAAEVHAVVGALAAAQAQALPPRSDESRGGKDGGRRCEYLW